MSDLDKVAEAIHDRGGLHIEECYAIAQAAIDAMGCQWRPIETYDRFGPQVDDPPMFWDRDGFVVEGERHENGKFYAYLPDVFDEDYVEIHPTYWMIRPLTPAPKEEA